MCTSILDSDHVGEDDHDQNVHNHDDDGDDHKDHDDDDDSDVMVASWEIQ